MFHLQLCIYLTFHCIKLYCGGLKAVLWFWCVSGSNRLCIEQGSNLLLGCGATDYRVTLEGTECQLNDVTNDHITFYIVQTYGLIAGNKSDYPEFICKDGSFHLQVILDTIHWMAIRFNYSGTSWHSKYYMRYWIMNSFIKRIKTRNTANAINYHIVMCIYRSV